MRKTALALLIAALAACRAGPAEAPAEFSLDAIKSDTQTLSSDAFEGRAPTTPGEERTVRYLAQRFQQVGLQPGNNGSWFQNVPLVETIATPTPLRITGGDGDLTFNYRTDMVANTYQVQPRVALDNSEIVFVGYGINAPEKGWNDYEGVDVRGKTVIILVNDPDYQTTGLEGPFNGRAMTYYGRWTYKYEEAARQGAAAAFIVHDTEPASYGWNVVQSSWTGAQYNMDDPNNHMDQSRVIGWLTNDAARRLFANSGLDLAQLSAQARQRGFRAVPLRSRASVSLENQIRRQQSRNVIGILRGRERPDEYVIYTAHWDHLGRCDADPTGDDICNGATDNASGTAGLIALAQAHVRAGPPERSIIFLAVTAEESGLLGSRYYGENPIYPLAQTVGGINMDSLSLNGPARDFVSVGAGKSQLDAFLERGAEAQDVELNPEPTPEAGYYYRSDHFSLARQGVPMLYPKLGENLVNGGPEAGRTAAQDYRANRYHQPSDEYNPNWNWEGALQELRLFYHIGRALADGDDWPNWNEGDEFRAIRDRSRPAR